ncbi:TlpA family protein disulfide reductase [Parabacteroides timonensis]|uniref:TlpA family protein disulfide reductase n=1 Tax=Parabacteroides timonensis TaxID=1871013 RepID=UPI00094EFB8E|nr:thioredoxin-like domain-containing protein [Parabacteroides timonensis]
MKTNVFIRSILCLLPAYLFQLVSAQLPVAEYQPGIAILTGKIKNFNPEQNLDIRCSAPNLIMMRTDPIFIQPDSTGDFRQNVTLKYTTQVRVKIGKDYLYLLMSPDNKEYHLSIEANEQGAQMPIRISGPYAEINNSFNFKLKRLSTNMFVPTTCELTPDQYKETCLQDLLKINTENNSLPDISMDAKKLMELTNAFECLENLNRCKYAMVYSRMQKDSLQRMEAFGLYKDFRLPDNYFDFLKEMPLNDPEALLCYNFTSAIPFPGYYDTYQDENGYEKYILANAPMSQEEKDLINDYIDKRYLSDNYPHVNEVMTICMKYQYIFQKKRKENLVILKEQLPLLTGQEHPMISEFADIRFARFLFMDFKPLTPEYEEYYKEALTSPLCINLLNDANESMKPKKKIQPKTGFILRDNPDCAADQILDAIIEKNKGKIQLIDMWATWCVGCRQTIKEYEPLKKDFPDVAFVYLTNETSPLDLWKKLIPDIAGEHYRLGTKQWDYLWTRFKLQGVPYYLIIDEKGEIKDQFIYTNKKEVQKKLSELVSQ